ncbi:MAG TPA: LytTR family DNA-binding domain-containing protein [Gemmatimonadales bacterium]|jgi:two-component system LytT family response regulator|nr:LytTR family DNA-binding domain-containing protein [Gemmatimonadales bacterium]
MSGQIRTLIVDDEPLARDCVRLALEQQDDVTVIGECADGASAVDAIRAQDPDLVFLDVQMPGLDGFGVIERIGAESMPPVLFVTAYDKHALRAFAVHALDFLLKPFDDERFRDALDHARRHLSAEGRLGMRDALAGLLESRQGAARHARRIMVQEQERIRFVPVETVDWFEADRNYVLLHCGKDVFRVRMTLTSLQAELDPSRFIRVHRSTVLNLDRIREVQPWFGGDYVALLKDDQQVRVSRRFREGLLKSVH